MALPLPMKELKAKEKELRGLLMARTRQMKLRHYRKRGNIVGIIKLIQENSRVKQNSTL